MVEGSSTRDLVGEQRLFRGFAFWVGVIFITAMLHGNHRDGFIFWGIIFQADILFLQFEDLSVTFHHFIFQFQEFGM